MNVLLSIKPAYVEEIVNGNKKYEFRRVIFKNKKIKRIYIYATAPVGKIVASFTVSRVIEDTPTALWRRCRRGAGISRKDFFEYFEGSKRAFAIQIGAIDHFEEPIDPQSVLEGFTAPQSFFYLPSSIPELDSQDRRLDDF